MLRVQCRTILGSFSVFLAAIGPLSTLGCSSLRQIFQPFTSSCVTDNQIAAKDREAANQAAIQFVQSSLGPTPGVAYSAFTADAKKSVSSEEFTAMLQQDVQRMGPFKDLRVTHTYLAKVTGGTQVQRVVCGNFSRPENWVAVAAKPGPPQAHVIVEGQTINNTWAFVIWLFPEQENWHVQYFQVATATMAGKSAIDLQSMAQVEQLAHHNFNAYILYAAALQLAARGPHFQLGIQPEIQKSIGELQVPRDLQGQPPFEWEFGKSSFKVLNVGPIAIGGKIYLKIDHEIESWAANREADKKNHDLIAAFANAYPEYKDAFSGLIVNAHERGGSRGFGTVDEHRKPSQ